MNNIEIVMKNGYIYYEKTSLTKVAILKMVKDGLKWYITKDKKIIKTKDIAEINIIRNSA